ncbi:Bacterial SH3 domain protein [Pseudovibrio axinellae]|uniref:Bacterial SH3 domain protein n=1 Tax=Pseudovibrio axinellae TaxID=989403 RepID=A0A165ZMI1_9HYPH|nr:SH3 domain-containing protein [Pseudovibrio axinellae]KZL20062.1 Bacterial SH3 domain protein [Pseudovibrio axinellae]SEQ27053.1 SH3 domain-containing protein [Pseudovibrio axinellae]
MRTSGIDRTSLMVLCICVGLFGFASNSSAQTVYQYQPKVPIGYNSNCAGVYAVKPLKSGMLNLRTGPGTNYRIIGHLVPNQAISVFDCKGNWLGIRNSHTSEQIGWVHKGYMKRV